MSQPPHALPATLPWRHFLLALAVVTVWGTNFVVIKVALGQLPPFLFAALRFTLALVPALFFLPRPAVKWQNLALYGVLIGVGQFGLLYLAMNGHISPGIASLVIQIQVFFTIGLSMRLAVEHQKTHHRAGVVHIQRAGIGLDHAALHGIETEIQRLAAVLVVDKGGVKRRHISATPRANAAIKG